MRSIAICKCLYMRCTYRALGLHGKHAGPDQVGGNAKSHEQQERQLALLLLVFGRRDDRRCIRDQR